MKILIVDDEFAALAKMKAMLEAYGDCSCATNGYQALEQCATAIKNGAPFDLVTIDIELPNASGFKVLAAVNKLEGDRDVKPSCKIMVTASGTRSNLLKAATKGCNGFLVKPVKRDTLDEKMASLGFAKRPD